MVDSRHLVDPELLPGLALIPDIEFSAETLPDIRLQIAHMTELRAQPTMNEVRVERRTISALAGHDVPVLIIRPKALTEILPAVLYLHGGAFLLGSAKAMQTPNSLMALEAGCVVVSVDYRLAPETPHPGPIEDCYAALRWLHDNAASLGVDPARIAVAGESAGGGLAAALALLARDRGEVPLVHQHLIYPMLDDRTGPDTANPYAGQFIHSARSNRFAWSSLLGQPAGSEGVSPYAAAARAEDLAGLPGAYIAVGALDLFAEENLDYARRLMRAGVPVELHLYPGAYHGFELAANAALTLRAHDNSINALQRALRASL
ncbi:alpha/beta hydrolase [Sphingobium boeckii]|uniref:Acetyl esterase/lipase n=1 Tax=Sphingobium boeckii TaxID=1082345 RepID=A0A7W9AI67_9SPHN|nr:alpha/beta hydrolase [Sphingobium boeckii]MBB5685962.1 acetyl esterase/lipase [Sphingobium boeckii]